MLVRVGGGGACAAGAAGAVELWSGAMAGAELETAALGSGAGEAMGKEGAASEEEGCGAALAG